MNVIKTEIPGVILFEPKVFQDSRGSFFELWKDESYLSYGIPRHFRQDNVSTSEKGVLRGLHFQSPNSQGKLVSVLSGSVFDVVVDTRLGSPTFGQSMSFVLSSANKRQLYVPEGMAHGFCVTSDSATFFYKCTDTYHPESEYTLAWNDPELNIKWPLQQVYLSNKDKLGKTLSELMDVLPQFDYYKTTTGSEKTVESH